MASPCGGMLSIKVYIDALGSVRHEARWNQLEESVCDPGTRLGDLAPRP